MLLGRLARSSRAVAAAAGAVSVLGLSGAGGAGLGMGMRPWHGQAEAEGAPGGGAPTALSPEEFRDFRVTSVQSVSPNTKRLRVALPTPEHVSGVTVASCVVIKAPPEASKDGKKPVVRPFTPTSKDDAQGHMEFIIKGYPDGQASKWLVERNEGDVIQVKGPFVKLAYERNMYQRIGLIAGGSGITPCLQIIRKILSDPEDTTEVSLIFANETEADILCRDELEQMAREHHNFHGFFTLSHPPEGWNQGTGYVSPEMIARKMPAPEAGSLVAVCGPPPMMRAISGDKTKDKKQGVLSGLLKARGFTEENVYKF